VGAGASVGAVGGFAGSRAHLPVAGNGSGGEGGAEPSTGGSFFGGSSGALGGEAGALGGEAGALGGEAGAFGGEGGALGGTGGASGGTGGVTWTPHAPCLAVGVIAPGASTPWPNPNAPPNPYTIDTITMQPWYQDTYAPQTRMWMGSFGNAYFLSDGSSWGSGAGSASYGSMSLDHITHHGALIAYHMVVDSLFVERTDYDSGDHSAHFRLETLGDWTIIGEFGTPSGTLVGQVIVTMDEPANAVDGRFSYLSSPLCAAVPVTINYTLVSGVFDDRLFDNPFDYVAQIVVDLKPQ